MLILTENISLANHFLYELIDEQTQKDSMRHRPNLERLSNFFAHEISKTFNFKTQEVFIQLGIKKTYQLSQEVVLVPIL
jgi:uracil phosphoribosyltransferase